MSNDIQTQNMDPKIIESLMVKGDLSALNTAQKLEYYRYRCDALGLDPATKPFDLLHLQGKAVLYANASCTQQLCNTRNLSVQITHREKIDGLFIVSARCTDLQGRSTDNMAALPTENLKGDALANQMMKCATKAIRRTVLAHCGLGMMDETETETIPGAVKASIVVSDVTAIEDISQDVQNVPVFVPGAADAYKVLATREDAIAEVRSLCNRIADSVKVKEAEKNGKIRALIDANPEFKDDLKDILDAL